MIGLSDHTDGIVSSICATSLGVVAIEKHFKLNKKDVSEDSKFSILPNDLKKLRNLSEKIFFSTFKKNKDKINKDNLFFRRSIYASKNLKKNSIINKIDIKTLRPNIGIDASYFEKVINKKINKNIKKNNPIYWKDLIQL